jgi:hypothetical protein
MNNNARLPKRWQSSSVNHRAQFLRPNNNTDCSLTRKHDQAPPLRRNRNTFMQISSVACRATFLRVAYNRSSMKSGCRIEFVAMSGGVAANESR